MITIRSSEITNWLVERKIIKTDYFKSLAEINNSIRKAEEETSSFQLEKRPISNYDYVVQIAEFIQKNDTSKDSYFRENYSVRVWKGIQSKFEYNDLIIAEYAERLNELANQVMPKLSNQKADLAKQKLNLESRLKQYQNSLKNKEDLYNSLKSELNLDDDNFKINILEEAVNFLDKIHEFSDTMVECSEPVNFYKDFIAHFYPSISKCRAISTIIKNSRATFYEYEVGHAPSVIRKCLDQTQKMLEDERKKCTQTQDEDVGELDFDLDLNTEIDFDIQVEEENSENHYVIESIADATNDVKIDETSLTNLKDQAEGQHALDFIDTSRGRTALINDLIEIKSFFIQYLFSLDEHELSKIIEIEQNPMLYAVISKIFQNLPPEFRDISPKKVIEFIQVIEEKINWLNNENNTRLFMVRHTPGYVDRFVEKIKQLKDQIKIQENRIKTTQSVMIENDEKIKEIVQEFKEYFKVAKQISEFLKKNISKKINYNVTITGLPMMI